MKTLKKYFLSVFVFFVLLFTASNSEANPVFTSVTANLATVSKYQKFELTINLTASFSNPYDFNQVNLKCKFTSPTGIIYNVDGFYYQAYNMPQPNNLVAVGSPDWRVRFAPNETGTWSYLLTCTDINGTTTYPSGQFTCNNSALRGFIHPAANNQFVYDDGSKFLGIGTNLGWTEWSQGFTIYQDWIGELAANGGNFTKIVMAPWSFEIEWQETGLGNYSARQNRAWALDWIYDHLASNGVYCQLNIMIHDEMKPANMPGWVQNPYNMANGGPCSDPQNFLVNTTAKNYFQRKIRYIIARWGYSPYTASWEILSEADNTSVYADFRTQTVSWLNEMSAFTKNSDIRNRPVSSGFAIPEHDPDYWNSATTTFTQMHIYDLNPDIELKIYNYTKDYLTKYAKPAIVGEFSLAYTPEEVFQNDPTGINFHNTLWASALSGSVTTAMSWWWNTYLYPNGFFEYFGPLSTFFGQVNFPASNAVYESPLCTSDINTTLDIYPGFVTLFQKAPASNFVIEPNGSLKPNELNLGKYQYGYFFNSSRNPPTFNVNYTKPGEFTVFTGANVSLAKIKIWLDGVMMINNTASANAYYTISVPVGQHTVFVENVGNGIMEITKYRLLNYAPVLRSFVARNSDHAIGWIQNKKYNWEYINQNGTPPQVTGGKINLINYTKGLYKIDWFNSTGNYDSTSTQLNSTGNFVINTPKIIWDGAFEMNYFSPLSIAFTASPTSGDAPLNVQFTDASFNSGVTVDSYFWDFGDGSTSNLKNPAHVYSTPGVYDVFFKIKSGMYADSILKTDFITITQPLVSEFTADYTQRLLNYPVHFSDLSLGEPSSWLWNFGDNYVSTLKNPTHHYTQPGFYDVMLTISKGAKSDTEIKYDFIEVYTPLAANFSADKTFALTGDSILFTDLSTGSPESWKWDFGNGEFSTNQNPYFAFDEPGIYSVELLVEANWRTDSLTKFNYITIADPLIAGFEADKTLAFVGETIHFTDFTQGNPATWFWDFGNGLTSTQQNPDCLYNSPGTYTVKLIVANSWLNDTLIIENYITIVEPLIADFIVNKTTAFTGDSIIFTDLSQGIPESWFWDFGNGTTSTSQNPVYTFTTPGIYNIKLVVANSWLTDSLIKENYITVLQPLTANFKADTTFAWLGHTTQFTDLSTGSPTSWSWDFGDQALSQLQNPSHTYNREGTYHVALSVANQYQNKTEIKPNYITIREPLKAAFIADTTKVIVGQSIRFTNLSTGFPSSRIWDFGDFTVSPLLNPRHSYAKPGNYTVSLQVFENDSTDFEIKENYIWVLDTLVAGFYATPLTIYAGESVNFYDTSRGSPNKWKWYFGEGKTNNLQNPVYKYNYPGVYTVRLIVSNPFDTDTLIRQSYITVLSPPLLQVVTLPQGWSGISTYLLPLNPGLPDIFQTIGDKLVFAMNDAGIYWPSQNINTIGNWNPQEGLIIKMNSEAQIEIRGDINPAEKVNLSVGWNILPVISTCSQSTTDVFSPLGDTLVIIKEIAGTNVFWPQPGINDLQYIDPGKAYYILVNSDVLINFTDCNQDAGFIKTSETNSFFNPWNDFQKTSSSHSIAIDKKAFIKNLSTAVFFENDDVIGVFNENGFCSGIVKIYGLSSQDILAKPLGITAFGNNDGKTAADGFSNAEKMVFRLFKAYTGDFYELSASFENEFPNDDLFEINGLSGIGSFTIEKSLMDDNFIQIIPNQEARIFRIEIKNMKHFVNLEIHAATGGAVENLQLDPSKTNLIDFTNYENGIYLLRFKNEDFQANRKLVLH